MSIIDWLKRLFGTFEQPSPSDIVPKGSINQYDIEGKVEINLRKLNIPFTEPPKVWIPDIPNTNSMDPAMDYGHNNILIAGADEENQSIMVDFVKVGDIAVYRTARLYAIHRIARIGNDDQGKYFIFKGDNNPVADPDRVRENQILWLCIGTIY